MWVRRKQVDNLINRINMLREDLKDARAERDEALERIRVLEFMFHSHSQDAKALTEWKGVSYEIDDATGEINQVRIVRTEKLSDAESTPKF